MGDRIVSAIDEESVAARQDYILGQPPRIGPLDPKDFTEQALELTGRLRQIGSGRPAPTSIAEVPEIVATLLRHPALYNLQVETGIQLGARGLLTVRERELAILRVGWLCRAPFEWGEHVKKAKAADFTSDEIERVAAGSDAPGWDAHEAAILRAVEELHADAMISDATWEVLAQRFDPQQLIEFVMLIGQYTSVAYLQNSLRLRLTPGNLGLLAR